MTTIAVIDYGMGNLRSVTKALAHVGATPRIVTDAAEVDAADAVVLPGVGAFGDCVRALRGHGLVDSVRAGIESGRPFLGICLGLQALFDTSDEAPGEPGLGIVPGHVAEFEATPELKVPHMGWNRLEIARPGCPLLDGIDDGSYVYFVHSYYCVPADDEWTVGRAEYGVNFTAMIWRDRMFATQFHPEKSQEVGLTMLRRFVELSG